MKTSAKDVGARTRGVKLKEKDAGKELAASEFFEGKVVVRAGR